MRWMAAGLPVVSMAFLLFAASALAKPASSISAQRCTVVIYLTVPITSVRIGAVKSRLSSDAQVRAFRFVSRAQAFDQLRKRSPELAANLASNPLPARLHVQLKEGVKEERFVSRYRRMKLRGVEYVRRIDPSHSSCLVA
jgi:cell division protein FtsX